MITISLLKSKIRPAPLGNPQSKIAAALMVCLMLMLSIPAAAGEWSGYIATESRLFPQAPLSPMQRGSGLAFALQPEYYHQWTGGTHSLLFIPFFRYDPYDNSRTHWDLRELYWQWVGHTWELRVGLARVFWGVTESLHLVDVINQSDQVEDLNGEQKLGQPMINFVWIRPWGTLHFFLLTGFRERTFPGPEGRLRFPLPVDTERAVYESPAGKKHIDWAIRWVHTIGAFDIGLSHFSGTSREPRFVPVMNEAGETLLIPHYDLINQTGLDLQYIKGNWLWKLEAISRSSRRERFNAFVLGFEYTFWNVKNSGIDIGLLAEYLYDDRDNFYFPPTPFEDDIFIGTRLAFNDVQGTDILTGAIIDRQSGSTFFNLEASRRLGNRFKLSMEIRSFLKVSSNDLLYGFRRDSYMRLELARYF